MDQNDVYAFNFCFDKRLWTPAADLVKTRRLTGRVFPVPLPGGVKDFVSPEHPYLELAAWHIMDTALSLGVTTVILSNHNDCKKYPIIKDYQEEQKFHIGELMKAREKFHQRYHGLKVELMFGHILDPNNPDSAVVFKAIL